MSTNAKPVLTYWPIGGLGTACRLALIHAVGIDGFVDRQITNYEEFAKRSTIEGENPFLNLPYIEFPGGRAISQSNAVLKAIGRRYHLNGETLDERDLVDELLFTWVDFHNEYVKLSYVCPKEQFEEHKADYVNKTVAYYYGQLDKLLATHETPYLAGNKVTIADFKAWGYIDSLATLLGESSRVKGIEAYPNVVAWVKRLETLPSVQAYLESPAASLPANGKSAHWGGTVNKPAE
jgi:glutathione S-transferase